MARIRNNRFATVICIIFATTFFVNLALSWDGNFANIVLNGGGKLVDDLGVSWDNLFGKLQIYRLITYGYLHPTIWHLAANAFALWCIGFFIEKELNAILVILIYHVGLIVPCIAFLLLFPNGYLYGASPAIFCLLGLMTMWFLKDHSILQEYKRLPGSRYLLAYMVLSNFLGLGTFIVHLAGFCTGMVIGSGVKRGKIRK